MIDQNLGNTRSRELITCRPASEGYAAISQSKEPPFLSTRGTSQFMIQSKTKEPPRSYHLITCQWGVCIKIEDKGAAGEGYIPAKERFDHFSSQLEVDYSIYSRERFSLSMWSLTIWSTTSFSLPKVFEHTSHFTPGSALSAWTCCIWDIKPPCVRHNFSHFGHL